MPKTSYNMRCIALTQLETGLGLFKEGRDYFSVITLAGAAEEILGKLLMERGATNSLESLTQAAVTIHRQLFDEELGARVFATRANRARNVLKHYDPGQEHNVTFDCREEATDILDRAISNYWHLEQSLTPRMTLFVDSQRAV